MNYYYLQKAFYNDEDMQDMMAFSIDKAIKNGMIPIKNCCKLQSTVVL